MKIPLSLTFTITVSYENLPSTICFDGVESKTRFLTIMGKRESLSDAVVSVEKAFERITVTDPVMKIDFATVVDLINGSLVSMSEIIEKTGQFFTIKTKFPTEEGIWVSAVIEESPDETLFVV